MIFTRFLYRVNATFYEVRHLRVAAGRTNDRACLELIGFVWRCSVWPASGDGRVFSSFVLYFGSRRTRWCPLVIYVNVCFLRGLSCRPTDDYLSFVNSAPSWVRVCVRVRIVVYFLLHIGRYNITPRIDRPIKWTFNSRFLQLRITSASFKIIFASFAPRVAELADFRLLVFPCSSRRDTSVVGIHGSTLPSHPRHRW